METKNFGGEKITIRKLSKKDLGNVKKFQDFINSLIGEDVKITLNKKISLREENKWLKEQLRKIKKGKTVILAGECNNMIVGIVDINLGRGRQSHVGYLGISVKNGYRGIGLGTFLMKEIIKLAERELKPRPKIIRLSVFLNNKPALKLYKKFGFKKVARIPKQIKYKGKLIDEIMMLKYL